jgi:hypothetical protein
MATSRLRSSALRRLESVRAHFPELDRISVRVGRTQSRKAHAWASLDPRVPAVWIKPGSLRKFTVAHEFMHLLQARGLVPRGEKMADLHAIARHAELIDKPPAYLRVPRILFDVDGSPRPGVPALLHRTANQAIEESQGRPRRAVRTFESLAEILALPAAMQVLSLAQADAP